MNDYPYLPAACRQGRCDHDAGRCFHYRSRRCESGECRHASQNLVCAVSYPPESSETMRARAATKGPNR
ncbi:hypothetical protein [Streptomyces rochei]|uniref:hypothetical protein n=1 Tax=Streptomyces rochei TaxID=1928 RepID=UPI00406393F6